jgi:hypothetical protein
MSVQRPRWKIEIETGDRDPYQAWTELHAYSKRYRFVEREDAERELERFQRTQPEAKFRIAPM